MMSSGNKTIPTNASRPNMDMINLASGKQKMRVSFFEENLLQADEGQTRASTFSHKGLDEMPRIEFLSFQSFPRQQTGYGPWTDMMTTPVDENAEDGLNSPGFVGAKSPLAFQSPVDLNFLEEESLLFEEEKKKSKTEFAMRRERVESDDSGAELEWATSDLLNTAISGNSFKFTRSATSRFSFPQGQRR